MTINPVIHVHTHAVVTETRQAMKSDLEYWFAKGWGWDGMCTETKGVFVCIVIKSSFIVDTTVETVGLTDLTLFDK